MQQELFAAASLHTLNKSTISSNTYLLKSTQQASVSRFQFSTKNDEAQAEQKVSFQGVRTFQDLFMRVS